VPMMMVLQLLLFSGCLVSLLVVATAISADEVPAFRWRVRTPGCAANVSSRYGTHTVWHANGQWSEWVDFNANDTAHWLATYPDTSERHYDNYFPLVTVVIIRAPPSCYDTKRGGGLLSYEMAAAMPDGRTFDLKSTQLDLNAEPGPANVSTFGVMACNTSRSNGLAGGNASWTPCWPGKVMTTRDFNARMIWKREGADVSSLPAARAPRSLPIVTTVRSITHDVGEYSDSFIGLRRLGFNQICIDENGMTGPTRPMYSALVAAGVTRTGFGTHSTPGGGWDSGDNHTLPNGTRPRAGAWEGGAESLKLWAQGLAKAWQAGGVPLDQFGVTSVKVCVREREGGREGGRERCCRAERSGDCKMHVRTSPAGPSQG
jgi:hypothetical protein